MSKGPPPDPDRFARGVQSGDQGARGCPYHERGEFCADGRFRRAADGAGTKTTGVVRCDQPRALDLGARGGKKLESVPGAIMDEVLARLAPIFE